MKNLIDVKQMAEKICSTVGTVYAWVSMKRIPAWCVIKTSKRVLRFDEEAVDKWLDSYRQGEFPIIKYKKWRFNGLII